MKLKLGFVSLILLILVGCSVADAPNIQKLDGDWRIYIGGEYSYVYKEISIDIDNQLCTYDNVIFDSTSINKNKIIGIRRYNNDSTLKIDLTLTFEEDKLWGYEIIEHKYRNDSTYIYGERLKVKKDT
jgi:hypothetical protein